MPAKICQNLFKEYILWFEYFWYGSFFGIAQITSVIFRDEANDILAVGDWGQRLSFYQISGKQVWLQINWLH